MGLQQYFDRLFGSYNDRELQKLQKRLPAIHAAEEHYSALTLDQLQEQFLRWKETCVARPETVEERDFTHRVFAAIRCVARHLAEQHYAYDVRGKEEQWNMIPYDVQLIGGMVLHEGKIAEMRTGEGKTLVCTLPVILNALTGKGVHVVTVNDYLAVRDMEWMRPLYEACGLTVGCVLSDTTPEDRQVAYKCDVTYGTNNQFGFDYLRDNMAQSVDRMVQRGLHYAIVDEVDSILIDESRTPLIISSPAAEGTEKYKRYASLITSLRENEDYNIDHKQKVAALSEAGIAKLERVLGIENIYTEAGFDEVHHIENALKANVIMEREKDYIVRDGEVIIVDQFTGRLSHGRRFGDGLHQALEAKEGVPIQRESKTLATITFQNYFRLYEKLSGMTGTAETEAEEFAKIYGLDTLVIPTNKPIAREDLPDKIFKNERGKFTAVAREVQALHEKGQPVLVGTVSIEKSEYLSALLQQMRIPHTVLNAKQHERESEIVAEAGKRGAVTIATNMAGRGTDIKIREEVRALGGLAVLGTERHESRRIDNQLRGRSGRQGDPGFSQFYVSMTDELMRRFGGDRMAAMMERFQMPEDEAMEHRMLSRSIESAQKRIEGHHFDARKHLVQYDDVMNIHREKVYAERRKMLSSESVLEEITQMLTRYSEDLTRAHAPTAERADTWDTQELAQTLHTLYPLQRSLSDLEQLVYADDVQEFVTQYLHDSWAEKQAEYPPAEVDKVAKWLILRSTDELWLEHINSMAGLRDRVALSGYAQKDPVMEYKREAYETFVQLLQNVRATSVRNLLRVQFQQVTPAPMAPAQPLETNEAAIEHALEDTAEYSLGEETLAPQPVVREVPAGMLALWKKTISRNDPCPCGSGLKFKKCHGA
ncbi:preprotein translocase subunit SecA [Candidatus Peribacteria bacterium]|nr:preprotein translocase subunit SecA [Candidatus Peribacteria bacterium]